MTLKPPRNLLKWSPDSLKAARNCMSIWRIWAVFSRKQLAGNGLQLRHAHDISKPFGSKNLRTIMSFLVRQTVHNTLAKLEIRQSAHAERISECYTKYNNRRTRRSRRPANYVGRSGLTRAANRSYPAELQLARRSEMSRRRRPLILAIGLLVLILSATLSLLAYMLKCEPAFISRPRRNVTRARSRRDC